MKLFTKKESLITLGLTTYQLRLSNCFKHPIPIANLLLEPIVDLLPLAIGS
jgi:hypothetical protein